MDHHCHAHGCTTNVPPKMLMCLKHWRMVSKEAQAMIWQTYRPGQEIDKQPSRAYMIAQRACIWIVFVKEGGCTWPDVPKVGSEAYMIGPDCLTQG